MNENNEVVNTTPQVIVKTKTSKGVKAVLVILIIMVLGLCSYIVYDKYFMKEETKTNEVKETQTNVKEESKNDNTTVQTTTNNIDKEQILKEVNQIYSDAYDGFYPSPEYGQSIDYYKNKYSKLFTDKGAFMVFSMFQDERYPGIMSTMFNETDQGKRTLSLVLATDDTAIATGTYTGEGDKTPYPEYIVFKKVDGVWKIDMFE